MDVPSLASNTIECTHLLGWLQATRPVDSKAGLTYLMALLRENNDPKGQYMCRVPQNSSSAQTQYRLFENLLCLSS